jgi:Tol biopolymer transport system component
MTGSRRRPRSRVGIVVLAGMALAGCWDNVTGPEVPPGRIVFRTTSAGGSSLVLSTSDGMESISFMAGPVDKPAWSPNSRLIAFQRQTRASRSDVWVVDVVTSDSWPTFRSGEQSGGDPSWAPSGDRLAYGATIFAGDERVADSIVVVNASGNGANTVTSGWDPAWGPDGRIAFVDRAGEGEDLPAIWLLDDRDVRTRLTTAAAGTSDLAPAWSSTGRLAWVRHRVSRHGDGTLGHEWSLMVEPAPGVAASAIITDSVELGAPAWSPEATHLVFNAAWTGTTELWVMKADGSERRRITSSRCEPPCGNANASWTPDAR